MLARILSGTSGISPPAFSMPKTVGTSTLSVSSLARQSWYVTNSFVEHLVNPQLSGLAHAAPIGLAWLEHEFTGNVEPQDIRFGASCKCRRNAGSALLLAFLRRSFSTRQWKIRGLDLSLAHIMLTVRFSPMRRYSHKSPSDILKTFHSGKVSGGSRFQESQRARSSAH